MSSWMMHDTSWCTCSGEQSTSVRLHQYNPLVQREERLLPGVPCTISFICAMCFAASSSTCSRTRQRVLVMNCPPHTFGLTDGSHNLCSSSLKDLAISAGGCCRPLPPKRKAIVRRRVRRNAPQKVKTAQFESTTMTPKCDTRAENLETASIDLLPVNLRL